MKTFKSTFGILMAMFMTVASAAGDDSSASALEKIRNSTSSAPVNQSAARSEKFQDAINVAMNKRALQYVCSFLATGTATNMAGSGIAQRNLWIPIAKADASIKTGETEDNSVSFLATKVRLCASTVVYASEVLQKLDPVLVDRIDKEILANDITKFTDQFLQSWMEKQKVGEASFDVNAVRFNENGSVSFDIFGGNIVTVKPNKSFQVTNGSAVIVEQRFLPIVTITWTK